MNTYTIAEQEFINALVALDGWYECPQGADGTRFGPLVGYAGRDENGKQFVGDVYLNAAVLEHQPMILMKMADLLAGNMRTRCMLVGGKLTFCGAPMGGIALAEFLSFACNGYFIYPEKEVTALATESLREQSRLAFKRHEVHEGDEVVIVEDVCNNFSTTSELIKLITSLGGTVAAITCLTNRSLTVRAKYDHQLSPTSVQHIPIFTLLDKPIPQYKQTDPAVVEDIAIGNVAWKPKNEWVRLMDAMNNANRNTA